VTDWLRVGRPEILVRLRRLRRARRVVLRLNVTGGAPVLTCPAQVSLRDVQAFLDAHEEWLRTRLMQRPVSVVPTVGAVLPIAGEAVKLALGRSTRFMPEERRLDLPGPVDLIPAQAAAYLRARARQACSDAVERYAGVLRRPFGRMAFRDTRSRWGSCSSRGDLMFSWRLAMAPPEVLEYVAAHEVAHLAEMNHGPRFWATVAALVPDYAAQRAWLKAHGGQLHRYDFRGSLPAAPPIAA
jgi:predicted metal-dependent hydrolase